MLVWQPSQTAPINREIEVAALDGRGYHVLAFCVRRADAGWTEFDGFLSLAPTHRRERADDD
jgi:hypothetical protein